MMTVEEIKESLAIDLSANTWLREICLQLAVLNAKLSEPRPAPIPPQPPPQLQPRKFNR